MSEDSDSDFAEEAVKRVKRSYSSDIKEGQNGIEYKKREKQRAYEEDFRGLSVFEFKLSIGGRIDGPRHLLAE